MSSVPIQAPTQAWSQYLEGVTLFDNAIRLRHLIWTIAAELPAGSRLLEVGCGSGTTAVLLADMGFLVTAVDLDETLVARMAKRYSAWAESGRLQVQAADMTALPWDRRSFDLAYHQGVLEHFPDEVIVRALREQRRVAGKLIFDVPNHRHRDKPFGDERLLPAQHWRRLIGNAGWRIRRELGEGYRRSLFFLPYALFSRGSLTRAPWFSRRFAANSIFVCD
jgi:SAM-dependent methyltransferase